MLIVLLQGGRLYEPVNEISARNEYSILFAMDRYILESEQQDARTSWRAWSGRQVPNAADEHVSLPV
jgi:hypothetical protein